VETPSEIYADKVLATLGRMNERGSIKATDLFDLDYIVDNLEGEAEEAKLERKAETYQYIGWTKEIVEKVLSYINDEQNHDSFIKIIKKTLLPDVFETRTFDKEYFEKSARHFEKLRHI
jgi:hypothetical protein